MAARPRCPAHAVLYSGEEVMNHDRNVPSIGTTDAAGSGPISGRPTVHGLFLFLSLLMFCLGPPLIAQTWNGAGTNDYWGTGSNWVSGTAPVNDGTARIVFSGSTRLTPFTDSTWDLLGITFSNNASAFTLSGSILTNRTAGIVNNSANLQTINNDIVMNGAQTWNAASGNLLFGGAVNNGGSLLTASGANNITISGIISGTGGLTKSGAGMLTLSGANTFSGTLTLTAGTLALGNNLAGGTGGVTVSGGTIQASGGSVAIGNVVTASGNFTIGGSHDLTFTNSFLLNGGDRTLTVDNTGITTLSGQLGETSGGRKFVKAGSGTLVLTASNAIQDEVTVSAGVLNIQHGNALDSTSAKTKVESGAALELQGGIAVGNETLELRGSGISNGGALRNVSGNNSWAGSLRLNENSTVGSDSGVLTISGEIDSNGKALTLSGASQITLSGVLSGSGTLTKTGAGTTRLSGANTYSGATTISEGTVIVEHGTGFGTTAGGVSISSGAVVQLQGGIAIGTEALTLNGDGIGGTGSLLNLGGANSWSGNVTLGSASTVGSTSGTLTLSGSLNNAGYLATFVGAGNSTLSGVISGTGGLAKTGAGTLTLSGNNTFSGVSTISGGVVDLQHDAALGSTGAGTIVSNGAAIQLQGGRSIGAEALTLHGAGVSNDGALRNVSGVNSWSGTINLGANTMIASDAGVLTLSGSLTNNGYLATFTGAGTNFVSGVIVGAGGLTKTGTGTLTLSGANTFSGSVLVSAGVLNIQNSAGLGATSAGTTVADGAALQLQGGISVGAESLALSGSGISSSGALRNISGNNTYGGTITLGANSAIATDANMLSLTGSLLNGGYVATFAGAGTNVVSGVISGSGALTKSGSGVLALTGAHTYTGGSTIDAGTVLINSSASLGDASGGLTINAGTLRVTNGFSSSRTVTVGNSASTIEVDSAQTFTLTSAVGGAGGLTKSGSGTLTLSVANTFSGGLTLSAGTLRIGHDGGLGTGTFAWNGGTLEASGGARAMTNAFTLGGDATLGGSLDLTFSGNGVLSGNRTLTVNNSGSSVFLGVISESGGARTLTKAGSGTLLLSGANTFSGGLTLSAGTLRIGHDSAAGSGTLTLNGGTVIQASGAPRTLANAVTLAGDLTFGGSQDLTLNGTATLTGNRTLTVTNTTTFGGAVGQDAGGRTLTKAGAGTLAFTGSSANTYSGATTVNEGTLLLGKTGVNAIAGSLTIGDGTGGANADVVRLNAANQIADASAVTINSSGLLDLNGYSDTIGTLTMTGGNVTSGAGTLTLGGTLTVNADASTATISGNLALGGNRTFTVNDGAAATDMEISAVISGSGNTLTKSGAGTLLLSGANTFSGGLTLSAGTLAVGNNSAAGTGGLTISAGTIQASGAPRSLANAVTLGGNFTVSGSENLTFSGISTLTGNRSITVDGTGQAIFSGEIAQNSSGRTLTKLGTGTLVLAGSNSYSGATTISAGTVNLRHANGLGTTSGSATVANGATLEIQGGITVGSQALTINGTGVAGNGALRNISGSNAWGGNFTLGSAATISSDSGILNLSGNIANGGYNATITGAGDVDFSGVISGTGGLIKNGSGTLILNGSSANTHSGDTVVNEGTLLLAKTALNGAITDTLTIGDGLGGEQADVVRYGASMQVASGSGTGITLKSSGWLDLDGYDDTIRILSLEGGRITTGTGTLTLASDVTYASTATNTTYISGNLNLGANRDFSVNDGTQEIDLYIDATISGAYNLKKKNQAGRLVLAGNNTYSGSTIVEGGSLRILHGNALGATNASTTVNSGAALEIANNINVGAQGLTMSGSGISGSGALRNVSGTNSWAGNVTLAAASTIGSDAGQLTLNGVISGNHALTKTGAGVLALYGTNTFNGGVTVNAGTVLMNNNLSLGASNAAATVNAGTLRVTETITATRNITLGSASSTIEVDPDKIFTVNGVMSGTGGLVKTGNGTVIAGGNNTFTGNLNINEGTLLLGNNNRIADTVAVSLNGATLATGGYSETVGTLTLTADSIIDFGEGATVLRFANSSAVTWTSDTMVIIKNWSGSWEGGGTDQIYFGSNASGLTSGQLSQIRFEDGTGRLLGAGLLANGELAPTPEPGTWAGILAVLGLVGWRERKRLVHLLRARSSQ